MRVGDVQQVSPIEPLEPCKNAAGKNETGSFRETLATFLNDVNDAQKSASNAQMKLLTGEVTDVHQVMAKSNEASVAFNLLMELRNKAIDGYKEIIRLRL